MIISSRILTLSNADASVKFAVKIFIPEIIETEWICRYEIDWPEGRKTSAASGLDSVQSLHLAMQKIGIDLYMSDAHATGNLFWTSPGNGYGFPVPRNGRDLLVGEDRDFEG